MKKSAKTILALAAGLTALASCSKNPGNQARKEIVFGISGVRVETRSLVETDFDELKDNGFRVFCMTSGDEPPVFNTIVRYDGTDKVFRDPSTRYYYPESNCPLSFGAIYPPTETIQMEDGIGIIHYSQNPDKDLCAAHLCEVQECTIMLNFSHPLARISFNCAAEDEAVDCKIDRIGIVAKNKAKFIIDPIGEDDYWEDDEDTEDTEYPIVSASTAISTTMAPIGETMTFIPGDYILKVKWSVYRKGSGELLAQYSSDITGLNVSRGVHKTFNLTIPYSEKDIHFVAAVSEWGEDEADIGPACEKGIFTVNRTGKKVRFAKGNLFWNGSRFAFETHQYDVPRSWDASHVGHFFWSEDAAISVAKSFSHTGNDADDRFFAADGGAIDGYTVLSKEEWTYVMTRHLATTSEPEVTDNAYAFTIAGVKCLILTPDFFTGELKNSYSASEWAAAESRYGLVALPFAGNREGPSMDISGITGHYWSNSITDDDAGRIWEMEFSSSCVYTYGQQRSRGCSVRLVSVQ